MNSEPLRAVAQLAEHHRFEDFEGSVASLDRWLRQSAWNAAAAGTAATYVLCRGVQVIGYYALAMGSASHAGAPSRLRRGVPDPVPVVLVARLALDRAEQGNALGGHLLVDALHRCVRGGREFGARTVIVDAIDDQAAAFYHHFGFHLLDDRRLWRRLSDVGRAIGQYATTNANRSGHHLTLARARPRLLDPGHERRETPASRGTRGASTKARSDAASPDPPPSRQQRIARVRNGTETFLSMSISVAT